VSTNEQQTRLGGGSVGGVLLVYTVDVQNRASGGENSDNVEPLVKGSHSVGSVLDTGTDGDTASVGRKTREGDNGTLSISTDDRGISSGEQGLVGARGKANPSLKSDVASGGDRVTSLQVLRAVETESHLSGVVVNVTNDGDLLTSKRTVRVVLVNRTSGLERQQQFLSVHADRSRALITRHTRHSSIVVGLDISRSQSAVVDTNNSDVTREDIGAEVDGGSTGRGDADGSSGVRLAIQEQSCVHSTVVDSDDLVPLEGTDGSSLSNQQALRVGDGDSGGIEHLQEAVGILSGQH